MARKALIRGIVTSLLALAVATAAAPPACACGSPYYYADFAYELYPDYPLDGFAGGTSAYSTLASPVRTFTLHIGTFPAGPLTHPSGRLCCGSGTRGSTIRQYMILRRTR